MVRDTLRPGRPFRATCTIALLALLGVAGCATGRSGAGGDGVSSRSPSQADASFLAAERVRSRNSLNGGRLGIGDGGCSVYRADRKNEVITADPRQADAAAQARLRELVNGLCFGLHEDVVDRRVVRPGERPVTYELWLQPELRMHQMSETDVGEGQGMVVAKLRNESGNFLYIDSWRRPFEPNETAVVWFGRANGRPYALVLGVHADGVEVLAPESGEAAWRFMSPTAPGAPAVEHRRARASWELPAGAQVGAVTAAQAAGRGWLTCLRGYCVAERLYFGTP